MIRCSRFAQLNRRRGRVEPAPRLFGESREGLDEQDDEKEEARDEADQEQAEHAPLGVDGHARQLEVRSK